VELDDARSVAARNLGLLAWKRDADLTAAANWYRVAMVALPDDQTLHRDLAQILLEQGQAGEAITVLEGLSADEFRRPDVVVLLADTYANVGRFDDAIALLEATTFNNREGVRDTWEIFARAHIEGGIEHFERGAEAPAGVDSSPEFEAALADFEAALTYPANLNAGRPHDPVEARAEYWRGRALEALGASERARQAWQACAAGIQRGPEQLEHIRLCEARLR
jgi:thioredoxin-like negative regulator of GroEL